jgi:PIN domain nuclease of toxin-antitoxin system
VTATGKKLLLDTHVFLWWRGMPDKLLAEARTAIAGAEIVFVSAASAWEAAIKSSLGRLEIPGPMEEGVVDSGFEKLPITFTHVERTAKLPLNHRDPFDRLLVAQAQAEGLQLVTRDRAMEPYEVSILWA